MKGLLPAITPLAVALLVFTASVNGTGASRGILEVRLQDHREAIDDFSTLNVTVDKILISPKPGLKFWQSQWKSLDPALSTLDLTQYTGKKNALLFRGEVEAGAYDAIHLKLGRIAGNLKNKGQSAPRVKNLIGPIKLPFEVGSPGGTVIIFDLVVEDMSDHPPRGYELGLKGYELYTNGKLVDKIPPG